MDPRLRDERLSLALPASAWGVGPNPRTPVREAGRTRERRSDVKDSEYGGADTDKTNGIQPFPHELSQTDQLRLMYGTDPASEDVPDLYQIKGQGS